MSKTEEIIRRYAAAPDLIEGFGAWLVSDRDSAAKDAALAELWTALEAAPAVDDAAAREKKLEALLGRLPAAAASSSPAPVLPASSAPGRSIVRRLMRYSCIPLAAAACVAAVLLLRTPAPELPVPAPSDLEPLAPVPELLAETAPSAPALQAGTPAAPASSGCMQNAAICIQTPQKQPAGMQNPTLLHTDISPSEPGEPPSAEAPAADTPDPWKAMEEEDRRAASKAARRRRASVAIFGAGGAVSQAEGAIRKLDPVAGIIDEQGSSGPESGSDPLVPDDPVVSSPDSPTIGGNPGGEAPIGERTIHDLPLNFGLSLRLPIIGRISLESGVTYSFLRSTAGNMHYLGLPLYLQCDVIRGKRASVYVGGGGSLSYCIAGGGKEHPWQPAVTVSAGAGYRIFRGVSIFGEASFNHYFDDGSSLETYYSLNPDAPSFKVGLRFELSK